MTENASTTSTELTYRPSGIGVAFVPLRHAPEELPDFARMAEASGAQELWLWEDCFHEGALSSAAVALSVTSTIRVGISLMPTPLRNVALTAMEISTLTRTFPGRFMPGLGHGVQGWMSQAGARVASPLTHLREQATALRRLLDGEEVTVSGRYVNLHEVRLAYPPIVRPPLLLGGTGPKTLALSAELGDAVMLGAGTLEALHSAHENSPHGASTPTILPLSLPVGTPPTLYTDTVAEFRAAGATSISLVPDHGDDPAKLIAAALRA